MDFEEEKRSLEKMKFLEGEELDSAIRERYANKIREAEKPLRVLAYLPDNEETREAKKAAELNIHMLKWELDFILKPKD